MAAPTNLDVIRRALRLLGVLAIGKSPSGAQEAEGMEQLQSLILDQPGLIKNGVWYPRDVAADYTAKPGQSIAVATALPKWVITLPSTISYNYVDPDCGDPPIWYGCCGDSTPPMDFSRVRITGEAINAGTWVYISELASWRRVNGIAVNDDFPFGSDDSYGMACQLALQLLSAYGAEVSPVVQRDAAISTASFRARFKKAGPSDPNRPTAYNPICADYW